MTEDRRGEIGLLLIEAMAFTECLGEPCPNLIENYRKTLNNVAQQIGVAVEDLHAIFRPAFDELLNQIFPGATREVCFRRDSEAKKIAIKFWELGIGGLHGKSPKALLNYFEREAVVAKISDEEMREWAESFFSTKPV